MVKIGKGIGPINADLYSQYVLDHEEHTSVKFE